MASNQKCKYNLRDRTKLYAGYRAKLSDPEPIDDEIKKQNSTRLNRSVGKDKNVSKVPEKNPENDEYKTKTRDPSKSGNGKDDHVIAKHNEDKINKQNRENIDPSPNANSRSKIRSLKRKREESVSIDDLDMLDPRLELLDPTPNIQAMFNTFNWRFFEGSLVNVQLKWVKEISGRSGYCHKYPDGGIKIALNENLLIFRERRDLVEVLLHEMIHAYAFVHGTDDGHGPSFERMMKSINKSTGANITVYHSFRNEVDYVRGMCGKGASKDTKAVAFKKHGSGSVTETTFTWKNNKGDKSVPSGQCSKPAIVSVIGDSDEMGKKNAEAIKKTIPCCERKQTCKEDVSSDFIDEVKSSTSASTLSE